MLPQQQNILAASTCAPRDMHFLGRTYDYFQGFETGKNVLHKLLLNSGTEKKAIFVTLFLAKRS